MLVSINPKVFELFPGFTRYVLAASNIDNSTHVAELEAMLRAEEEAVRGDDSFADIKAHPHLASWRDAFSAFGVNPNQCPPSVLNLIKRVRGGKDLPYINTLVCIFNICSMRWRIPAGGDDVAAITGDLELRPADGSESYLPLGGGPAESPKPGEIVLADSAGTAFCRAWCWRNSETTKIQESTTATLINLDILPPSSVEDGEAVSRFAAECIRKYCGADVSIHTLDAANPSFSL
ncbi:hypothetical protein LJC23_01830 [Desulfovibrio sp. OttesenSCG-928-I05]|nr:hypothetical protein [Desulfovibrio sp. OttesenSCG-928-I05]